MKTLTPDTGRIETDMATATKPKPTAPADLVRHLKSLLLQRARGGNIDPGELWNVQQKTGFDDADCDALLKEAQKDKAAETKAREQRTAFNGPGTQLEDKGVKAEFLQDKFLVWSGGSAKRNEVNVDSILTGDAPLTDTLRIMTRFHRSPGDDRGVFDYLASLLRRVIDGSLVPGRVALVYERGMGIGLSLLPAFCADNPPMNLDMTIVRIRAPRQSQSNFEEAEKVLKKAAEKYSNAMQMKNTAPAYPGRSPRGSW